MRRSRIRRWSPAGSGVFVGSATRESASSMRSNPFAVPLIDQKAGAAWRTLLVVVHVVDGVCWVRVNGTWFPIGALSGIIKSMAYEGGFEVWIRFTETIEAESVAICTLKPARDSGQVPLAFGCA